MFFFFQAEDGIRDHCVTGVQTCALPIYGRIVTLAPSSSCWTAVRVEQDDEGASVTILPSTDAGSPFYRSEERRVGKECRSRRRACPLKKKKAGVRGRIAVARVTEDPSRR